MEVDYFEFFNIKPELKEGDEIQCKDCEEWVSHNEWLSTVEYCETCGTHEAIKCPKCGGVFDMVWTKDIKSRTP
jgi:hypothetical protein